MYCQNSSLNINGKSLNYEIALDYFCRPTFSTSKELTAKQIYHLLLTEPVANSIDFKENILIGGDNASGKSTFLRTVAVNIVLAQSINIALANEFSMQHGNIFTLIKVQDSISRGESYFMAESRIVKSILDRLNNEQNYIFLDEIFRGTNAVERIGAAIGIMQWLNNHNCLYMISTHDLYLIELAKDWNETYHFTSSFINNKIIYDYKIKSGKPQTSNAVNILKTLSYPSEVVTVAQDTIKIVNSNF